MQLPRQRQRHTHTHTRTCAYSCCGHYCVLLGLIVMNYASTMMRIIHTALASCSIARWLGWYRYTESNALLLVLVVCLLTLVLTFDHIGSELDQNYSSSRHLTLRPNRMSSNSLCWLPHHRHIMKSVLVVVVVAVVVVVHGLIVKEGYMSATYEIGIVKKTFDNTTNKCSAIQSCQLLWQRDVSIDNRLLLNQHI
jgi:hypothetical protein